MMDLVLIELKENSEKEEKTILHLDAVDNSGTCTISQIINPTPKFCANFPFQEGTVTSIGSLKEWAKEHEEDYFVHLFGEKPKNFLTIPPSEEKLEGLVALNGYINIADSNSPDTSLNAVYYGNSDNITKLYIYCSSVANNVLYNQNTDVIAIDKSGGNSVKQIAGTHLEIRLINPEDCDEEPEHEEGEIEWLDNENNNAQWSIYIRIDQPVVS